MIVPIGAGHCPPLTRVDSIGAEDNVLALDQGSFVGFGSLFGFMFDKFQPWNLLASDTSGKPC